MPVDMKIWYFIIIVIIIMLLFYVDSFYLPISITTYN